MKRLTLLILLVILFSFISCKKESFNPLIGQWQWFQSSSGGRLLTTSETVDSTYYIEFSKSGIYYRFDNSKKIIETKKYEIGSDNNSNLFKFSEYGLEGFQFEFKIKNDTLSISNLDGFIIWTSSYKRI
jgi:hypothetical protein